MILNFKVISLTFEVNREINWERNIESTIE